MNTPGRLPILTGVLAIIATIDCAAAGRTAQVAAGALLDRCSNEGAPFDFTRLQTRSGRVTTTVASEATATVVAADECLARAPLTPPPAGRAAG